MKELAYEAMVTEAEAKPEKKRQHLVVDEIGEDEQGTDYVKRTTAFETLKAACAWFKGSEGPIRVRYCGCDQFFSHNEER